MLHSFKTAAKGPWPMKEKYLVIMQDEWNNLYYLGEYKRLEDALPDINEWLQPYNTILGALDEYPSTFGTCFDTEIETPDETILMVRGFVLEG